MALSAPTDLDEVADGSSGTSLTSNSVSPTGDALLVAAGTWLGNRDVTSLTDTLSGTGSWTIIQAKETGENAGAFIAYAILGSSPGSGTVTVTWTDSVVKRYITLQEFTGYNTSTPVPQNKSNTGTGASLTVTLDSTPASTSCVLGCVCDSDNDTGITEGSGFTPINDDHSSTGGGSETWSQSQYDLAGADTTCDWSGLFSVGNCGVAIEVAEAGGASVRLTAPLPLFYNP